MRFAHAAASAAVIAGAISGVAGAAVFGGGESTTAVTPIAATVVVVDTQTVINTITAGSDPEAQHSFDPPAGTPEPSKPLDTISSAYHFDGDYITVVNPEATVTQRVLPKTTFVSEFTVISDKTVGHKSTQPVTVVSTATLTQDYAPALPSGVAAELWYGCAVYSTNGFIECPFSGPAPPADMFPTETSTSSHKPSIATQFPEESELPLESDLPLDKRTAAPQASVTDAVSGVRNPTSLYSSRVSTTTDWPSGVYPFMAPTGTPPLQGCRNTLDGIYTLSDRYISASQKTAVASKEPSKASEEVSDLSGLISLINGTLVDQLARLGDVVANYQIQFDGPPQAGTLYTAGWNACSTFGSPFQLALGSNTTFWACNSGAFSNIYSVSIGAQCHPVTLWLYKNEEASHSIPDAQKPVQPHTPTTSAKATPSKTASDHPSSPSSTACTDTHEQLFSLRPATSHAGNSLNKIKTALPSGLGGNFRLQKSGLLHSAQGQHVVFDNDHEFQFANITAQEAQARVHWSICDDHLAIGEAKTEFFACTCKNDDGRTRYYDEKVCEDCREMTFHIESPVSDIAQSDGSGSSRASSPYQSPTSRPTASGIYQNKTETIHGTQLGSTETLSTDISFTVSTSSFVPMVSTHSVTREGGPDKRQEATSAAAGGADVVASNGPDMPIALNYISTTVTLDIPAITVTDDPDETYTLSPVMTTYLENPITPSSAAAAVSSAAAAKRQEQSLSTTVITYYPRPSGTSVTTLVTPVTISATNTSRPDVQTGAIVAREDDDSNPRQMESGCYGPKTTVTQTYADGTITYPEYSTTATYPGYTTTFTEYWGMCDGQLCKREGPTSMTSLPSGVAIVTETESIPLTTVTVNGTAPVSTAITSDQPVEQQAIPTGNGTVPSTNGTFINSTSSVDFVTVNPVVYTYPAITSKAGASYITQTNAFATQIVEVCDAANTTACQTSNYTIYPSQSTAPPMNSFSATGLNITSTAPPTTKSTVTSTKLVNPSELITTAQMTSTSATEVPASTTVHMGAAAKTFVLDAGGENMVIPCLVVAVCIAVGFSYFL